MKQKQAACMLQKLDTYIADLKVEGSQAYKAEFCSTVTTSVYSPALSCYGLVRPVYSKRPALDEIIKNLIIISNV
jgi:uncharacterized UPF0146 family protein